MKVGTSYKRLYIHVSGKMDGNMSFRYGTPENVRDNRFAFLLKSRAKGLPIVFINASAPAQCIHLVKKSNINAGLMNFDSAIVCDGLVTNRIKTVLALLIADCMPIVLYSPIDNVLAMIHSGFPGVRNEVVSKAISVMTKMYGVESKNIFAYIGPSIKMDSYIYSDIGDFRAGKWQDHVFKQKNMTYKVDLQGALISELLSNGLRADKITSSPIDTFKSLEYFSHYRSVVKSEHEERFMCIAWME